MNAQELRLNNFIHYKGETAAAMFIMQNHIECFYRENGGVSIGGPNDITPIPLSEEWLLNFGFVYSENAEGYIIEGNKECCIKYYDDEDKGWWYIDDSNGARCYVLKKIVYVHQLQNLYFIMNDKELNLVCPI